MSLPRQRNATLQNTFARLLRAETRLKIEGLMLVLQCDGSGSVRTFDEREIFRFDSASELNGWLSEPRIVEYDDAGDAVQSATASEAPQ